MLHALRDSERRQFIEVALLLCGYALALLPLASTSSSAAAAQAPPVSIGPSPLSLPEAFRFPHLETARDPFVPGRIEEHGAGLQAPAALVHAVVLGSNARALVETGGTVKILSIGDTVGSAVVVSIGADGVTLSNGVRLLLAEPARP